MNMKLFVHLVMCFIVTSICFASDNNQQAGDSQSLAKLEQYIDSLYSKDDQEREKANKIILNNYNKVIDELIRIVEVKLEAEPSIEVQKKDIGKYYAKEQAIILLGNLRAVKAVPILLENIEFNNPFILGPISYTSIGNLYKAAGSIVKIGMPAVEPVLKKLRNYEKYNHESEICCYILQKILGYKLAKTCIQITIDETKDENEKKNLSDALIYIETTYRDAK